MRVLVACESSGVVRRAMRDRGHDAYSCDLLPSDDESPYHLCCDVRELFTATARRWKWWDLMIAHPDCTYLTSAGLHWNKRRPERAALTLEALEFVQMLMDQDIEHIAIENPPGAISSQIRKPDQIIHPWQYGHPESKTTGLWLKKLPKLVPTNILTPTRFQKNGRPQWDNQTPSGQNKLGPSPDRWKKRSRTYQGWADAFAEQWATEMTMSNPLARFTAGDEAKGDGE